MIRKIISALAGLGALALSGCVTSGSTMDLIPLDQRPAKPLFDVGDYCNVEDAVGAAHVNSSEECGHFAWDASTRRYSVTLIEDGKAATLPVAIAPLRNGVLLAQVEARDLEKADAATRNEPADPNDAKDDRPPYLQSVLLVVGRAMVNIGWQGTDEQLDALAARHPKVTIEGKGASRTIVAGSRADALDYLWDFVVASLNAETVSDPAVSVRDKLGAPDHSPSAAQLRDIKAALKKLDDVKH